MGQALLETLARSDFFTMAALEKPQNAHLLCANCAFSAIFALPRQKIHIVLRSLLDKY